MERKHKTVNVKTEDNLIKVPENNLDDTKEEKVNFSVKCEMCYFWSESLEMLNFHMISHKMSPTEIFQNLPPELRNCSFVTKQDFQRALQLYLSSSFMEK